jgi:hypothetical protein
MLTAKLANGFDDEWADVASMKLGPFPPSLPTANCYCLILNDGAPSYRIDLYAGDNHVHQEVLVWNDLIVIGFGSRVFVVNLNPGITKTYDQEGYFGSLYPLSERLLIASAWSLRCLDTSGDLLWLNAELGIDGVIVNHVENGLIYGEGEWDPPGGWRPFVLDLISGQSVNAQNHSQQK